MAKKSFIFTGAAAALLLTAAQGFGWGFWGHREITARAIELLPEELSGFFLDHREHIVKHCVDPDLVQRQDSLEQFNHYIDLDYYGEYPFTALPHDYDEAVRKYGTDTVRVYGLLPWKISGFTRRLSQAMREGDTDEILHSATYLAHYVEDAHVPLHATLNYDGQYTNQRGIHSRFESDVPGRFGKDYRYSFLEELTPVADPLEFAFSVLHESYSYVHLVLSADSVARARVSPEKLTIAVERDGKQSVRYTYEYFDQFNEALGDIPRKRMEAAIVDVARYWYTAWILAGKPELKSARGG